MNQLNRRTIGIVGAGRLGRALAHQAAQSGIKVLLANRTGAHALRSFLENAGPGVSLVSAAEACEAEIVIIAVPWSEVTSVASQLPDWEARIVIDATNNPAWTDPSGGSSSAAASSLFQGAYLIKAFNTLTADLLVPRDQDARGSRIIFYSGDDARAKSDVSRLISEMGFAGMDLGSLMVGSRQQSPGGPFYGRNVVLMDERLERSGVPG